MAGFSLPPLKWLLVAAVAAGAWAYYNDPQGLRPPASRQAVSRSAPSPAASTARLPPRVAKPASKPARIAAPRPSAPLTGSRDTPSVPRPQRDVTTASVKRESPRPGAGTPLRAPQHGDCRCPYDLMIDGSACGDRSALARGRQPRSACYR